MAVSSKWFLLNRPEIGKELSKRLNGLGVGEFQIKSDFHAQQGRDKDPFVGVFLPDPRLPGVPWEDKPSESAVIAAVGCSGLLRGRGELGDAYAGLRAWPPFGGSGDNASPKGTLKDGVEWAKKYRAELNAYDPTFRSLWNAPELQWVAWRHVPDSSETLGYRDALCDAVIDLVIHLTR